MIIWKLKNLLFRILRPGFWIQNSPTCWEYDRLLREHMNKHGITAVNEYTANIGGLEIWIESYPYAFGGISRTSHEQIPSPITRKKLKIMVSAEQERARLERVRNDFNCATRRHLEE